MTIEYSSSLLPQHAKLLRESAISAAVAEARGYRSVTSLEHLVAVGFARRQCNVPGLLIPIHAPGASDVALHQFRPDVPRLTSAGRVCKYETAAGAKMALDIPPTMREALTDPTVDLLVTEGIRKSDAAASAGLACIALLGVWNWKGRNDKGGSVPLAAWEDVSLRDRRVGIAFDSDVVTKRPVQTAMRRLAGFLKSRGARVEVVTLPAGPNGEKVGLDDFLAAGHGAADVWALAKPADAAPAAALDPKRPVVVVNNRQLGELERESLSHLLAYNDPPAFFARGSDLVRVVRDADGLPSFTTLEEAALRNALADAAQFCRQADGGSAALAPPLEAVRAILARADWTGFPTVRNIAEAPIVRTDGSIVTAPGYDASTQSVYLPASGFRVPPISDQPTAVEIRVAVQVLTEELLGDFPFDTQASRANMLAFLLTPFVRALIAGPVPCAALDKPRQGSGASLLVDAVAVLATGAPASMLTAPSREEEWGKVLTSVFLDGGMLAVFDNIVAPLGSGKLAAAITARRWKDRLLGEHRVVRCVPRVTWCVTGNNLRLIHDLPRRCYWVRLDAGTEYPDERPATAFRHPDLVPWVTRERAALVAAVLTLCRHWFAERCPPFTLHTVGSFEEWARMIGGILGAAGIDGFLSNRRAMREECDEDGAAWRAFLGTWTDTFAERALTVPELVTLLRSDDPPADLRAALPPDLGDVKDKAFGTRLGTGLRTRKDQVFTVGTDAAFVRRVRLRRAGDAAGGKVARWQVVPTDSPHSRDSAYSHAEENSDHPHTRAHAHANGRTDSPDYGDYPEARTAHGRQRVRI